MTRLLVLYGTTDGHTRKIAMRIADMMRDSGVSADVADAEHQDPNPAEYTGVVVAASLHAGGYQRSVVEWAARHASALANKTTAFVTVCLGILQHEASVQRELERLQDDFIRRTAWTPTQTKHVAGALLYRDYNWFKRLAMVRIVRKAGGDTDTSRNYEYTDWGDVDIFAREFASRAKRAGTDTDAVA